MMVDAAGSKLLKDKLRTRKHFASGTSLSMHDVMELIKDARGMLAWMKMVRKELAHHFVSGHCLQCKGFGSRCRYRTCPANKTLIFPFFPQALSCPACGTLSHRRCYAVRSCPTCCKIWAATSPQTVEGLIDSGKDSVFGGDKQTKMTE